MQFCGAGILIFVHDVQLSPPHLSATRPTCFCDNSLKFVHPKKAEKRSTQPFTSLPPEVIAELRMLLDVQLQEQVEAVLASLPELCRVDLKVCCTQREQGER